MTETTRSRFFWRIAPLIVLSVLLPSAAFGHHLPPGLEEIDEFETHHAMLAGLRHPFSGWEHMLAAVGIGCFAAMALRGRKLVPALFAGGILAGGAAAALGQMLPGAVFASVAFLFMGALGMMLTRRVPAATIGASAASFGLWQGNAHGLMIPIHSMIAPYAGGFMTASLGLVLVGYWLGWLLNRLSAIVSRRLGCDSRSRA